MLSKWPQNGHTRHHDAAFLPFGPYLYRIVPFDAVIFDLDGTLLTRTQDIDAVYEAAFERVDAEPFATPAALWESLEGPPDPDDQVGYLGAGFARLAAQHGRRDVDPLTLAAALVDGIDDRQVTFRPGAERALSAADAAGAVGVLTNGPERRQAPKVGAVGLDERVETVVYAGDMPRRKPHAAPFHAALEPLSLSPADALYVGDSLAHDVAGAHTAGMPVAWLDDGDGPGSYRPEYVLDSLADLSEILS